MLFTDPPTTSETGSPTFDQCQQQVQRILKSATFRNAVTLQQLFQFLTAKVFEGGAEALKEYTIGVEAFGRPQNFDPKTDTIVRVQIHRLRQKLMEYYDADGSRDPILVEIPKGHYLPRFETVTDSSTNINRHSAPELDASISAATPGIERNIEKVGSGVVRENASLGWILFRRMAIATAAVLVVFATGYLIGNKQLRSGVFGTSGITGSQLALGNSADPVRAFWATFLGNDSAPVIAFPDAFFFLDYSNVLFRFRLFFF